MSRLSYYARRLVVSVVIIWAVITFLFVLFRLMPGDYATLLAGQGVSAETVEAVRQRWGLDQPLYVQYYRYMTGVITGDFGVSRRSGDPVVQVVSTALLNTLLLALPAIVVAILIGSIYGGIMGFLPESKFEKVGIIPPTVVGTMPDFFIGMLAIIVFSSWLGVFPTGSMASVETYRSVDAHWEIFVTTDYLLHYTLPFLTIVLKYLYNPALIMRGSMIEVQGQEFAVYQRLYGLKRSKRLKHLMRHASLPVVTLIPVLTATAIGGQVLIEIVFNWPGIGKLLFDAVVQRDLPVIQFLFIIIATWIILGNLVVDVLYTLIDPRITVEE